MELRLHSRDASGPLHVEGARTAAVAAGAWSAHLLDLQFGLSLDVPSSCSVLAVDKLFL